MYLMVVLIVLVVVPIMVFFVTHIYTVYVKNIVIQKFKILDHELRKMYDLIPQLLDFVQNSQIRIGSDSEKISDLRQKILSLKTDMGTLSRRSAYDNELRKNFKVVIEDACKDDTFSSNEKFVNLIQKYKDINQKINIAVRDYNLASQKLKIVTEVFPSSFVTRFNGIKWTSSYKEI